MAKKQQSALTSESSVEEIIQRCSELAEKFKETSAHHDRTGEFPEENFQEIRKAGLLTLMVPKNKGGLGADFLTYTKALEQLAMGDGSTALTFNMHNIAAGSLAEVLSDNLTGRRGEVLNDFRDWAFAEMVDNQKLFASANSEPGVGAHFSKLKSRYRKVDGGYIINGLKSFVSMAGHADYYITAAKKEGSEGDVPHLSFFVIEAENPGIKIDEIWDTLGMRATCSNMMHLNDVFVPTERLFLGSQGLGMLKLVREPHWVIAGYVGVYLGLCSATFKFMTEYLRNKKKPGSDESVITSEWVQHRVGELYVTMEACRTVVYDAARQVTENPGTPETNVAAHRSKYMVGEFGPYLASQAIRLCGGGSIARRHPLEQFYRDARCGGLMPATSDECLFYVGKAALGIDMTKISESYW
jgi:alkylation response protein AidB-like acyl-CoA dehydrogenase